MAYMTRDGEGPYPNKAGEYCRSHLAGSAPVLRFGQRQREEEEEQDRYLARMQFGRPRACKAGTSKEMKERGYVGLYLKNDSGLILNGDTDIPTPPGLMEPPDA